MSTLNTRHLICSIAAAGLASTWTAVANAQPTVSMSGAPCASPPVLRSPDNDCSTDRVINHLGPNISEALVELMRSARGGKTQQGQ